MSAPSLLFLAALPFFCGSAPAQDEAAAAYIPQASPRTRISPEMDRLILAGIDAIYRMDFDQADGQFQRLRDIDPAHPYSYFGAAAVGWTRYIYETEQSDQALVAPFEASVRTLVEKTSAWLKVHPDDAEAFMVLGAGQGILARLLVARRQYVKGFFSARTSMKAIRSALAIDPDLYDARLGEGMYDYYTDLYPRVVRVLAKMVLHGNRNRGIDTLRQVAEKGHFMSVSAQMLLVEIYNSDPFGAKDPEAAIRLMREIRRRYPDSAMMHAAQIVSFYEARRYPEALTGAKEYVAAAASGKYPSHQLAKGQVLLGAVLWAMGRKEDALEAYRKAGPVRYRSEPARWAVWGLINAGRAADLLGRRTEASELFRQAAEAPDTWDYRRLAAKQVSKAYQGEDGPPALLTP